VPGKSTRIYPNAKQIVGTQPSVAEIIPAPTFPEAAGITETTLPQDTDEHVGVYAAVLTKPGPTERPPPKRRLFMHSLITRQAQRAQLRQSLSEIPPALSLSNPPVDRMASEVTNARSPSTGRETSFHPRGFNSCLDDVVSVEARGSTQTLVYKPSPWRGRHGRINTQDLNEVGTI
jgi:hypothetical protein